jgi:hypothetical protein
LYYVVHSDTALISERQDFSEQLVISYGNAELKSPRVVTVRLVSRGRLDISREAFDEGKPLCLDLGTPIVDLVKVTTSPSDRPDPACTLKGCSLLIGPSHFGRRQTTEFSLLVDGKSPHIVPPKQTLIDVNIEHGDGETLHKEKIIRRALTVSGVMFLVFIVAAIFHSAVVGIPAVIVASLGLTTPFIVARTVPEWNKSESLPGA